MKIYTIVRQYSRLVTLCLDSNKVRSSLLAIVQAEAAGDLGSLTYATKERGIAADVEITFTNVHNPIKNTVTDPVTKQVRTQDWYTGEYLLRVIPHDQTKKTEDYPRTMNLYVEEMEI